jgi:ABC-type sugar transport system permease subunit
MSRSAVDEARSRGAGATLRELGRQVRLLRHQRLGDPVGYLLVGPAVLLYLIFNVYPVLRGLQMAFMDMQYLRPESANFFVSFNGLANYREMLQDETFHHTFRVSLAFSALYLPAAILFALLVAVLIGALQDHPLALATRVVMYLPVVIPISVAMLLFRSLYEPRLGYLNYALTRLPFISDGPNWLGPQWALYSLVIATVWMRFGYFALLFLIGIYQINAELYEAAAIDGATSLRQFWHITLPALRPIFVLILVLTGGLLGATSEALILTNGGPGDVTTTLGLYIWRQAFQEGNLRVGYAASMSLVLSLIQLAFAFAVFKILGIRSDA